MSSNNSNEKLWGACLGLAAQELGLSLDLPPSMIQHIRQRVLDHIKHHMGYSQYKQLTRSGDETEIIKLLLPRATPEPSRLSRFINKAIPYVITMITLVIIGCIAFVPSVGQLFLLAWGVIICIAVLWKFIITSMPVEMEVPPAWPYEKVGVSYQCSACGRSIDRYTREGWAEDYFKCAADNCNLYLCQECAIMSTALKRLSATCPRCSAKLRILKQWTKD